MNYELKMLIADVARATLGIPVTYFDRPGSGPAIDEVVRSDTRYNDAGYIVSQTQTHHCENRHGEKYTRTVNYTADFGNVTPQRPPNRALTLDYGNDD
jgi:hypothetical protein